MNKEHFSEAIYLLKTKAKLAGKIIKIPGIDEENFPVRNSMLGIVPQGKVFLSDEVAEFLFAVDEVSKEDNYEIPFLLFGKNDKQNVFIDSYVSSGISGRTEANFSGLNSALQDFISKSKEHLYIDGIISCPYVDENKLKDILILVPKTEMETVN